MSLPQQCEPGGAQLLKALVITALSIVLGADHETHLRRENERRPLTLDSHFLLEIS